MKTQETTHPNNVQQRRAEKFRVLFSHFERYQSGKVSFPGEFQGYGVDAVAEAGWCGAVVEDVAEVGFALVAQDFGSPHEEGVVGLVSNLALVYGCREAWPASSRIKLSLRTEQVVAATDALVDAELMVVPARARVGSLGTLLSGYVKLFRGQLPLPLLFTLNNLLHHHLNPVDLIIRQRMLAKAHPEKHR